MLKNVYFGNQIPNLDKYAITQRGGKKTEITIETPKGIPYKAKLYDIHRKEREVSCAVQKDGGDDPDITSGALIYAKVLLFPLRHRHQSVALVLL